MSTTLGSFLSQYQLERDLSAGHMTMLRSTIHLFGCWLGHVATLDDCRDDTINRWLVWLSDAQRKKTTLKGHRSRLLALWRAAFEYELTDFQPRRVRKIVVPKTLPEAWSLEQLKALLIAADGFDGVFLKSRIERRAFWRGFVLVAYDTGLRLGDLLALRFDQVGADGSAIVTTNKTGAAVLCRFHPETMAAIELLRKPGRPFIFGGAIGRHAIFGRFRELVARAGLTGTTRKLRRTSGTWVERIAPGYGHRHLGNGADVFRAHYDDRRISGVEKPLPPKIG